ncbi:MAG: rhamnulokinase [Anaerolineaceae bacterium]
MKALALDLGASGGKIFSGGFDGKRLEIKEIHRFSNTPINVDGHLYWGFHTIFENLQVGMRMAAAEKFTSFAVDSYCNDYGLLDDAGHLLSPVHTYRDCRTEGVLEIMDGVFSPVDLYHRTGNQRARFNTLVQLAAQRRSNESALLDQAKRLLFVPDLINFLLCGNAAAEFTIASVSQLFNRQSADWDEDILRAFNLPRTLFPQVVETGIHLGTVKAEILAELGVTSFDIMTVGHHDTASAVAAIPAADEKFAYISSGTWSLMGVETDQMNTSDEAFNLNLANEGGVGGKNRLIKNIMGLWLLQECQRQFCENGLNLSIEDLDAMAQKETPFRSLIDPNDEIFFDPGGMIGKIQNWCQQTHQPVPENPGQITRCIKESLALCYRETLEMLEKVTQQKIASVHIIGGGAKSDLLNQFAASTMHIPVYAGPYEATAIGNLCTQFMARGELSNLAEIRSVVRSSFAVREYTPLDKSAWDDAYEKFINLK